MIPSPPPPTEDAAWYGYTDNYVKFNLEVIYTSFLFDNLHKLFQSSCSEVEQKTNQPELLSSFLRFYFLLAPSSTIFMVTFLMVVEMMWLQAVWPLHSGLEGLCFFLFLVHTVFPPTPHPRFLVL